MALVNVNRKNTDQFYRYKMPKLLAKVTLWYLIVVCVDWFCLKNINVKRCRSYLPWSCT